MVTSPNPYQVPVLGLSEQLLWKIVRGEIEILQTSHGLAHSLPETPTQYFFARESCRESCQESGEENFPENISSWNNPPALNLYWFRWILSHHIIFLCWHRIVAVMQEEHSNKALGKLCAHLIKLCSLMLLYAASCPNALYKKHIRTFMALYHGGFTAKWSLEYHAYKIVTEKLLGGGLPAGVGEALRGAYYEHKMVHMAVAQKFMGHAPSLLKMQATGNSSLGDLTPETQFVYDAFFLVKRREFSNLVSTEHLTQSFRDRIQQVRMDLTCNPFFPGDKVPQIFLKQRKIGVLLETRSQILQWGLEWF